MTVRCYWCESNVHTHHFGYTYTDDVDELITDRTRRTYYHNACRYVHGTRTNPTPPRPNNNVGIGDIEESPFDFIPRVNTIRLEPQPPTYRYTRRRN